MPTLTCPDGGHGSRVSTGDGDGRVARRDGECVDDVSREAFGAVNAVLALVATVIGRWPVDATVRFVMVAAPATSPVVHLAVLRMDDSVTAASASWLVDLGPVIDVSFWTRFEWLSSEVVRPWLAAHGVPGQPDDVDPDGWSVRFARRVWQLHR